MLSKVRTKESFSLLAVLMLIQFRMLPAFLVARELCRCFFSLLSNMTLSSFSTELLFRLCLPRYRT